MKNVRPDSPKQIDTAIRIFALRAATVVASFVIVSLPTTKPSQWPLVLVDKIEEVGDGVGLQLHALSRVEKVTT